VLGLEVVAVSRVHNRALRDVFEARVAQLAAAPARPDADPYLPSPAPGSSEQLLAVLQQPGELAEARALQMARLGLAEGGGVGPVLLSNCVNVADAARVAHAAAGCSGGQGDQGDQGDQGQQGQGQGQRADPARGVLLVCRAHLVEPREGEGCSFTSAPGIMAGPAGGGSGAPWPGAHPGSTAAYGCKATDARQRLYRLEPALVLPEYLVEFRYKLAPESPLHRAPGFPAVAQCAAARISEELRQGPDALMGAVAQPLAGWLAAASDPGCLLRTPGEQQLLGSCQVAVAAAAGAAQAAAGSLGAAASAGIAACQQLQALTAPALAAYLCTQQLAAVAHLDLHGLGLQELAPLQGLPALEALLLSCNRLTSVQALAGLSSLTQLDLGFNRLGAGSPGLAALLQLPRLADLDLSSNQLAAAQPWLEAAAAQGLPLGPQLQRLDLRGSAAAAVKGHRSLLLQHLRWLRWLDGSEVAPGNSQGAGPLQSHCYTAQGAPAAQACSSSAAGGPGWRQQVAAVLMDQCNLRSLPEELAQLPVMARASFADNHLQCAEALGACSALQDLCLARNSLAGLSQLAALAGLVKLDVAHNQISSLEPLAALAALEQASTPLPPRPLPCAACAPPGVLLGTQPQPASAGHVATRCIQHHGRRRPRQLATAAAAVYPATIVSCRAAECGGQQRGRAVWPGGAGLPDGAVRGRQPAGGHAAGQAAEVGPAAAQGPAAQGQRPGSALPGPLACQLRSQLLESCGGPSCRALAAGSCPACSSSTWRATAWWAARTTGRRRSTSCGGSRCWTGGA
jgi:hypothetical protein